MEDSGSGDRDSDSVPAVRDVHLAERAVYTVERIFPFEPDAFAHLQKVFQDIGNRFLELMQPSIDALMAFGATISDAIIAVDEYEAQTVAWESEGGALEPYPTESASLGYRALSAESVK